MNEYDATNSGAQIAAGLTRNSRLAHLTNLTGDPEPQDLYTSILNRVQVEVPELRTLTRKALKTPTLAILYGGGSKSVGETLHAEGLHTPQVCSALTEILRDELSAVSMIVEFFRASAELALDTGAQVFKTPLATGITLETPFRASTALTKGSQVAFTDLSGRRVRTRVVSLEVPTNRIDIGETARTACAGLIQSHDAKLLGMITERLADDAIPFHTRHDAFIIASEHKDTLIGFARESFYQLFKECRLTQARQQIGELNNIDPPEFNGEFGSWKPEMVLESVNLLS